MYDIFSGLPKNLMLFALLATLMVSEPSWGRGPTQVLWSCPTPAATATLPASLRGPLPQEQALNLNYNRRQRRVDLSPVRSFLSRAQTGPIDYSPCLRPFLRNLATAMEFEICQGDQRCVANAKSQLLDLETDPLVEGIKNRPLREPLLPADFKPLDQPLSPQDIEFLKSREFVTHFTADDFTCHNILALAEASPLILSDPEKYPELNQKISALPLECRLQIGSELERGFQLIELHPSCTSPSSAHPVCQVLRKNIELGEQTVSRLLPEGHRALPVSRTDESDERFCAELKPGESIWTPGILAPSRLSSSDRRYVLRRVDSGQGQTPHYEAALNLEFWSREGSPAEGQIEAVQQQLNQCLRRVQNGLRGPNGERLSLKLSDPQAPTTRIQVFEAGARSNSVQWAADADCGTMVHEVLHLLGLCDEYPEVTIGYIDLAGAVVRSEDLWRDIPEMLEALPEEHHEFVNFAGFEFSCRATHEAPSVMAHQFDEIFAPIWREGATEKNLSQLPGRSLLMPGHWDAIIYPGCLKYNHRYYECSQFAYILTPPGEPCPRSPRFCRDGEWLKTSLRLKEAQEAQRSQPASPSSPRPSRPAEAIQ